MIVRVIAIAVVAASCAMVNAQEIAVYGTVTDLKGTPIDGVTVDVTIPGKGILDTFTTGKSGKYVFRVKPSSMFTLMFTHERFHLGLSNELSPGHDQQVGKTLYEKGLKLRPDAGIGQLRTYERAVTMSLEFDAMSKDRVLSVVRPSDVEIVLDANPQGPIQTVYVDALSDIQKLLRSIR